MLHIYNGETKDIKLYKDPELVGESQKSIGVYEGGVKGYCCLVDKTTTGETVGVEVQSDGISYKVVAENYYRAVFYDSAYDDDLGGTVPVYYIYDIDNSSVGSKDDLAPLPGISNTLQGGFTAVIYANRFKNGNIVFGVIENNPATPGNGLPKIIIVDNNMNLITSFYTGYETIGTTQYIDVRVVSDTIIGTYIFGGPPNVRTIAFFTTDGVETAGTHVLASPESGRIGDYYSGTMFTTSNDGGSIMVMEYSPTAGLIGTHNMGAVVTSTISIRRLSDGNLVLTYRYDSPPKIAVKTINQSTWAVIDSAIISYRPANGDSYVGTLPYSDGRILVLSRGYFGGSDYDSYYTIYNSDLSVNSTGVITAVTGDWDRTSAFSRNRLLITRSIDLVGRKTYLYDSEFTLLATYELTPTTGPFDYGTAITGAINGLFPEVI